MSTKKLIGRIPISKGEYVTGNTYNRLSQVTLYGSTYQSKVDGNTSAPAILDDNGNVQHANTDQWLVIADGREAYNAGDRTSFFSKMDNPEYLAVETDAEGRILASTNADGSHYAHNMKSETIPTEFEHIEDPEGRMEITTDAEGKVAGYRDSEGTRHEYKMSLEHLELSEEAATEVNNAFKSAGIKMENPSDFSNDEHIELPIPRIAAQVRIYAPKLPTTKTDDIETILEYNDKDGNYFRKPVILNAQGSSSMDYYVKNMAIDINDGSEIKFGDFPTQDSFHLKKYYIDIFRGQCIVGYHLMEQVYKSRPIGQQHPYELLSSNDSTINGYGDVKKDFFTGAKCHPDGFPINITWVNSDTNEETDMGIYTWNLKKAKEVYHMDKNNGNNVILDGVITDTTLFNGSIQWNQFEVRNPKSLKDIDEKKYDGDNPKELSNTDKLSKQVKDAIERLSGINAAIGESDTKETYEKYLLINPTIDYLLVSNVLFNYDGFGKNWIWCTWDGIHWCPTLYDADSIFGSWAFGAKIIPFSSTAKSFNIFHMATVYQEEIKSRYKELRASGIFTVGNICSLLEQWIQQIGYDNFEKEVSLYPETPSYRDPMLNKQWKIGHSGTAPNYDSQKTYQKGELCKYYLNEFEALETVTGIPPVSKLYDNFPMSGGCFNSLIRVKNWLDEKLSTLDKYYGITI